MDLLFLFFIFSLALIVCFNIIISIFFSDRYDITKNKWYHYRYLTEDMIKELHRFSGQSPRISIEYFGYGVEISFHSYSDIRWYYRRYTLRIDEVGWDTKTIRKYILEGIHDWNNYLLNLTHKVNGEEYGYIVELL